MIVSEITQKECIKERYHHSKANIELVQHCVTTSATVYQIWAKLRNARLSYSDWARPIFQGLLTPGSFSELRGPDYATFGMDIDTSLKLINFIVDFRYVAACRNESDSSLVSKIGRKFRIFTAVEFWKGLSDISVTFFVLDQSRNLLYPFYHAARRSGRLGVELK